MLASINAGKIVDLDYIPVKKKQNFREKNTLKTLSDGSAGNLEPGAVTFDLCRNRQLVSDWVSVTEDEIKFAIKLIATHEKQIVEGLV